MTYDSMRAFADSWFLAAMVVFFIAVVVFVFRPRSKETYEHMSQLPLQDDDKRG